MMARKITALFSIVAVALALGAPAIAAKHHHHGGNVAVHKPPYEKGNKGGDDWNFIETDPKSGHVSVLRLFPGISPIVGCAPEPDAGWATLTLPHHADDPEHLVTINFDAMLDPYAWVYAVVWDERHESLGVEKFQGPFSGSRKLKIHLFRTARAGSDMTIEFGAQVGDACPMVSGADVTFPKITIE